MRLIIRDKTYLTIYEADTVRRLEAGSLFSAKLLIPSHRRVFFFLRQIMNGAHMSEQASISEFRIYVGRDYRDAECWRLLLSTDR